MTGRAVPAWAISLGFAVVYTLSALLGRIAVIEQGSALGLFWPAAGVGVLWFLVRGGLRPVDLVLFVSLTYLVNDLTGSSTWMALVLVLANVVQLTSFLWVLQWLRPQLWGVGGGGRIDSAAALGAFLAAAGAGALGGATVGSAGLWLLTDEFGVLPSLVWVFRNLCGLLAVGCFGHLVAHWLLVRGRAPATGQRVERPLEGLLLLAMTVGLYVLVFTGNLPLVFPLLALSVWAGLRFNTVVATGHAFLCGVLAVVLTRTGTGMFAELDPLRAALFLQLFVIMAVVTSLALATSREEQAAGAAQLRRAQQEAAAQADLFEAVLESMHEGVLVLDGREVVFENPGARQLLAGTRTPTGAEVIAGPATRPDGTRIDGGDRPVARALAGHTVDGIDLRVEAKGGDRIMSVSARPLRATEQDDERAVIVFRDVTEDRARTADLVTFSGMVAHDLGNPLQVIDGWLEGLHAELEERLADGGRVDPADAALVVERVQRASARMRELIQDLLAHALAAERVLETGPVDLNPVARQAAGGRAVDLEVGGLPVVMADRVLVRQLFDNLVGNAVKYVAPDTRPRVTITADHVTDHAGRWVRVRIADNGIGIPEDQRQLVFRQFHRAHAAAYSGTGLGLSICQRIVERHGGTIRALANPDSQGSVFEFTLPAGG